MDLNSPPPTREGIALPIQLQHPVIWVQTAELPKNGGLGSGDNPAAKQGHSADTMGDGEQDQEEAGAHIQVGEEKAETKMAE